MNIVLLSFSLGLWASQVAHLPAAQETCVQSLVWEDPLEKGMATCSSILAWRIPWTEDPGKPQSMGLQRIGQLSDLHFSLPFKSLISLSIFFFFFDVEGVHILIYF